MGSRQHTHAPIFTVVGLLMYCCECVVVAHRKVGGSRVHVGAAGQP
jgi:hypothetical protein